VASVQALGLAVTGTRSPAPRSLHRMYLARGGVALIWAAGFAAASGSLNAPAVTLIIAYPLIDVVASGFDVRIARAGLGSLQTVNAAISLVAAIAVGIAGIDDTAAVLHVFGAWALVSGAIQVLVAVKRRPAFGTQWAMLVSGGLSMIAGLTLNLRAAADHPQLGNLIAYAALGGVFFIADAVVLGRRSK
jgi:uncharacterized membrane protein HdeD (DUF308 family)